MNETKINWKYVVYKIMCIILMICPFIVGKYLAILPNNDIKFYAGMGLVTISFGAFLFFMMGNVE